uniref:Uncharacterized protein LOC104235430 n=1 Tax=Nicotiana sylvestris TaxID=4096 RepID=A0A1U7XLX1_NICSY|nr:PREDICTED: uncharacterized protein LOC104235430 [Nicotiana sylvestris]
MGYSSSQKEYIIFDLHSKVCFVSRDAVFKEDVFPFKHSTSDYSILFHVLEFVETSSPSPQQNTSPTSAINSPLSVPIEGSILNSSEGQSSTDLSNSQDLPSTFPSTPVVELRKSSRTTKPPVWLKDFVVQSQKGACQYQISNYVGYNNLSPAYQASIAACSAIVEPRSFSKASQDPKWIDAMQAEIAALEENNTWSVVDLLPGKTLIGCKWVFKVKYKSTGEVERYKARLVAKGYSHQEGLDYTKKISPVVKMMDVHNVFLQGDLLEEVYMTVPDGFSSQREFSKKSKKQGTISRSSAEAEFRSIAVTATEVVWMTGLFKELKVEVSLPTRLFCDSKTAI